LGVFAEKGEPGYPLQVLDQFRYHCIGLWAFHFYPSRGIQFQKTIYISTI